MESGGDKVLVVEAEAGLREHRIQILSDGGY